MKSGCSSVSRFGIQNILTLATAFLIAFAGQAAVSAQTVFAELTKTSIVGGPQGGAFGSAVSIDGNTMIAGRDGPFDSSGAAYIYVRGANGAWTLQQGLGGFVTSSNFGMCVGVSGDTAIVGAPNNGENAAYIYTRTGTTWTQQARLTTPVQGGFGQNCAISGDTAAITARNELTGVVYIFVRNGATWTQQAVLTAITPDPGDIFGDNAAIDGNTVVIGVQQSAGAFRGSVQVFVRNGTTWAPQQKLLASDGLSSDLLGASVAINGDTIVAGAPQNGGSGNFTGAAYVFTRSGSVWTQQQKLTPSDNRPQVYFGSSTAIENNTAIVGARKDNLLGGINAGVAYSYQRSGTNWAQTQKFSPADIRTSHNFGWSMDLSGGTAVISSPHDSIGSNLDHGSAYIYVPNPVGCTFTLSSANTSLLPAAGSVGNFGVTTQAGCAWQATVQDTASGVTTNSAGTGSGTVNFTQALNAGPARRSLIHINGVQTFTVDQASSLPLQQGDFDTAFGNVGVVRQSHRDLNHFYGTAVQSDGKTVAVGQSFTSAQPAIATVVRYNTDGSLDTGFDGDGIAGITASATDFVPGFDDVAIQTDGKIIAVGNTTQSSGNTDFLVVRFNTNGTLDTTFGTGGIVRTNFGTNNDVATSIALAPGGKIVVAGFIDYTFNGVVRYNANGTLDTTLDTDGIVIPQEVVTGNCDVAVQTDGKIVIAGRPVTTRLNTNGSYDITFDVDGMVSVAGSAVAITTEGKLLIGGGANDPGGNADFAIRRLTSSGAADIAFGTSGVAQTNFGFAENSESYSTDLLKDIVIQPDGKIIAVGSARSNQGTGATSSVMSRYNPSGSADTGFGGGDGIVTTDFPFYDVYDVAEAVALQPDGKIVVVGVTNWRADQDQYLVMRFLGEGSAARRSPFDFDGDGKTDLSIFRPNGANGAEWWWLRSSGGNGAVQFGGPTDTIAATDFTGDGKTDVAFFRPSTGLWYVLRSEDFSFYAFPFGTTGDLLVPADYDGDGKADAAIYRPSALTWYISKSTGGTDIVGFGAAGDKPIAADYDGDGKADIAVFRPNGANGAEWWIRRSGNLSVFATQFGAATDKALPADYTGDGKADVAFWRPSTGQWYILRSEDSSFFAFPFGTSTDVPTPGDYDGDGKTDAAVFRPSNSTWYVQRSTAGLLIQQFGTTGDVPVPNAFVR